MQSLRKYWKEISFSVFLIALFAVIRLFESSFYDPFSDYFKGDFSKKTYPEFDSLKLFFSLLFRYFLNSVITLLLVQTIFKDKGLTKFAGVLLSVFFVILISAFFILASAEIPQNSFLFYVRRFLIQPIFALLFLPAFYYQKKIGEK